VASDQSTTSRPTIDVGLTRVEIPEKIGRRSREWAAALPYATYLFSGSRFGQPDVELPTEQVIEAIRLEARQEVLLAVERALVKQY